MSDATARTGLTLGGQLLGAFLGGPIGAAVGSIAGSVAGWALFPEHIVTEGPRLNDLKITSSAYGESLPVLYGGMRVAGKVIWANPLREVRTEQEAGGKGGPTQTQVAYSYFADFAMALCDRNAVEGGIVGIARMWINGQLVYDVSPGATGQAINASANYAAIMQIYPGSQTQLPDPTIEAALGVGNASAYRGTAYAVFTGLDVTSYGGSVPNIEVEVITDGTAQGVRRVNRAAFGSPGSGTNDPLIFSVADGVIRWGFTNGTDAAVMDMALSTVARGDRRTTREKRFPAWGFYGTPKLSGMFGQWLLFDDAKLWSDLPGGTFAGGARVFIDDGAVGSNVHALFPSAEIFRGISPAADNRHFIVLTQAGGSGSADKWYLIEWNGSNATIARQGTCDQSSGAGPFNAHGAMGQGYGPAGFLEANLTSYWVVAQSANGVQLWTIGSDNVMRLTAQPAGAIDGADTGAPSVVPVAVYADRGLCVFVLSSHAYLMTRIVTGADESITLGTVVNRICQRAGYAAGELNTSALTDAVNGYAISQLTSARNAIQPLQQAYWFDCVESAGQLKFVKRGGASVATVPVDDLVFLDGPGGGDRLPAERQRASEPPREVSVSYYAAGADYQTGAQNDRRATGVSQQVLSVQLPLVLTDTAAKRAASVLLYDAWQQRTRRRFATWRKWAELEATDVITVTGGSAPVTLRLSNRNDRGELIEFDAAEEATTVYTKTAIGATVPGANPLQGALGPTFTALLDVPLFDDADDYSGFYAALAGYTSPWPGARLYRSTDAGTNYDLVSVSTSAAVVGVAVTVLGDYTGPNVIDETNSLTVELVQGTLASCTLEQMLAGANAAVVGAEVIQFRTATLVSGKRWTVTGLRRGVRGTEQHIGAHAADETFVLLQSGPLRRVVTQVAQVNEDALYKGVTAGLPLSSAVEQTFKDTGAALKPYGPVRLGAALVPGGADVLLYWTRRGRVNNEWLDAIDVPMGETAELYDVEILNAAGAVVRTFSAQTTSSLTYTTAQQTADFGAAVNAVTFRVYQISASVGRGFPATATVLLPKDPFFLSVAALLHCDGANNSTTFTDVVPGNVWSASGDARLSTAQQRFGTASIAFDGTGDSVSATASHRFGFGASDYTVEFFVRFSGLPGVATLFDNRKTGLGISIEIRTDGRIQLVNNVTAFGVGTIVMVANTWYHVAVSRNGGNVRSFINGVLDIGPVVDTRTYDSIVSPHLGSASSVTQVLNGWLDEIRITNGVGRYTSAFTPPALPFTDY